MSISLANILYESAKRFPDVAAVIAPDRTLTYAQLWDDVRRYAAVLQGMEIGRGDRVALLLANTADFPRIYFAVQAIGAVGVPVHALLRADEIRYILEDSGAKVLIVGAALSAEGEKAARSADVPCFAIGIRTGQSGLPAMESLAADVEPITSAVVREANDDAMILYTSGTMGAPKGAVLSQLNLTLNALLAATGVPGLVHSDVILGCLPLFHTFGQTCAMNAGFLAGAPLVLMARFDGASALELMVAHGVTVFMGVPTMYIALIEAGKRDSRRPPLRIAVSGGAPLPETVLKEFQEVFGVPVYEGYGLSETSPVATFNDQFNGCRPGTVGHPIWGVDVEIAKPDVADRIELLDTDAVGEIVIRGHNVMSRYHNRPAETAAAIVDGWFRTGDLGAKDSAGFISVVDRIKDMVIRGGYNVYPREVEEALLHHQGIAQVAVIGVPDSVLGQEICAVAIRSPDRPETTSEEIIAWAKEHLAGHKYPRRIEFVDTLPLGPSGKVLKRLLVERYADAPVES